MPALRMMNSILLLLTVVGVSVAVGQPKSSDTHVIIETRHTALAIRVGKEQNPTIVHFGQRLSRPDEYARISGTGKRGEDYTGIYNSVYTPAGSRNLLEPAIQVTHADGNPSLDLRYVRHDSKPAGEGVVLTTVYLTAVSV